MPDTFTNSYKIIVHNIKRTTHIAVKIFLSDLERNRQLLDGNLATIRGWSKTVMRIEQHGFWRLNIVDG